MTLPHRRHCHRLLGAAALTVLFPGLSACAAGGGGAPGYTVSQQRLNELLARQFPVTRNLWGGLADLTLSSPRLGLLPASNRIATMFDLGLTERIAGTRYSGGMDLDYGVRLDLQEGAVRMTDVRVNRLTIDQLPRAQQQLVSQYAPDIAGRLLSDMVLYRLPSEQLALARNLGWGAAALRVLPDGLRIDMAPPGVR
ncbi:DUF1439 domain-containing protein [Ottowia testudinis]|uniref:DUF1439 domain-containing protein n=1 Tax=Ottowia testudinis TaxID=2816950 RepID=A0A975H2Z4_9BURK|nr:DUF1439 domain-containing protein [Ottowia testudinis]QTD45289.1 DUF1439 domain-containing protein [Ottowia testudinis]